MATFKAEVQKMRSDKTYLVYIRCTQNRKNAYIKTDMYVHANKVKDREITDQAILARCGAKIAEYLKKLNYEDIESWTVDEVVSFISSDQTSIPFVPFCKTFIAKLKNEGRDGSASNYSVALNSFSNFFNETVTFQNINSKKLNEWKIN